MRLPDRSPGSRLHKFTLFIKDGIYDHFPGKYHWKNPKAPDWPFALVEKLIEQPFLWTMCKIYGHEPCMDQCGMPEHDFCVWCNKLLPHSVMRPEKGTYS